MNEIDKLNEIIQSYMIIEDEKKHIRKHGNITNSHIITYCNITYGKNDNSKLRFFGVPGLPRKEEKIVKKKWCEICLKEEDEEIDYIFEVGNK